MKDVFKLAKHQRKQRLSDQRWELLQRLDGWLDTPMLVLAFVWLALFIWEMVWGLNPLLETVGLIIWGLFILDF